MGVTQNQGSLNIAQASAVDPSFGRLDFKEAEKQRQEVERLRRKKISEANKGRTPWNKGRKGMMCGIYIFMLVLIVSLLPLTTSGWYLQYLTCNLIIMDTTMLLIR